MLLYEINQWPGVSRSPDKSLSAHLGYYLPVASQRGLREPYHALGVCHAHQHTWSQVRAAFSGLLRCAWDAGLSLGRKGTDMMGWDGIGQEV